MWKFHHHIPSFCIQVTETCIKDWDPQLLWGISKLTLFYTRAFLSLLVLLSTEVPIIHWGCKFSSKSYFSIPVSYVSTKDMPYWSSMRFNALLYTQVSDLSIPVCISSKYFSDSTLHLFLCLYLKRTVKKFCILSKLLWPAHSCLHLFINLLFNTDSIYTTFLSHLRTNTCSAMWWKFPILQH